MLEGVKEFSCMRVPQLDGTILHNFRDSKAAVETYRDGGMCSFACLEAPVSKACQRFHISLRKSQHFLTDF
jgi:hypothetical protein